MGKSLMQCDIELHFGANGDTEWSFPKHTFPINHSSRGGCVWARWKRVTSGKGGKHEEGDAEKEREVRTDGAKRRTCHHFEGN